MTTFSKPLTIAMMGFFAVLGGGLVAVGGFFLWASSGRLTASELVQLETTEGLTAKTTADEFTVVAYNIGYLSGLTNNQAVARDELLYRQNLETAIAALQTVNPDIVALQEIDLDSRRSFRVNQVDALATALAFPQQAIAINWDKRYVPFPYWPPTAHFGEILSGQAILSQFPLTTHERLVLDRVPGNPFYYNALYLDRLAQVATVQIGERSLVVINLHLEAFDAPTRQRQTEFVLQLAETYGQQQPVLLLGDFNSAVNREAEGEPRSITTVLDSPIIAAAVPPDQLAQPEQFTFPSDKPQHKLDYVFYTPDSLEVLDVQVLTAAAQASDHLPVVVRLRFR